jgi:hypothetical protein
MIARMFRILGIGLVLASPVASLALGGPALAWAILLLVVGGYFLALSSVMLDIQALRDRRGEPPQVPLAIVERERAGEA